jgi:hypothetical protein
MMGYTSIDRQRGALCGGAVIPSWRQAEEHSEIKPYLGRRRS